jgi:hypothetical protein
MVLVPVQIAVPVQIYRNNKLYSGYVRTGTLPVASVVRVPYRYLVLVGWNPDSFAGRVPYTVRHARYIPVCIPVQVIVVLVRVLAISSTGTRTVRYDETVALFLLYRNCRYELEFHWYHAGTQYGRVQVPVLPYPSIPLYA